MKKNELRGGTQILKKEFIDKGNKFTQIYKNDFGFIYAINDGSYYEVFLKKTKFYTPYGGKPSKVKQIVYPNNEAFGTWAWTFLDKESALQKLDSLRNVEFV